MTDSTERLQELIEQASEAVEPSVVAFTGAGVSTESGIPDFRSPDGVWAKNRTVEFDEFLRSGEARYEYWRQKSIAHSEFVRAEPNVTHRVLADWERTGLLRGVITQNIDGLHSLAGSGRVLELHGTARRVGCLDCGLRDDVDAWVAQFCESDRVPDCPECGGRLKHATVSFGQSLPENALNAAVDWARECRLMLALGSSLVVHPAASIPALAAQSGARLVIINRDPTPLDHLAELVIRKPLGQVFETLTSPKTN